MNTTSASASWNKSGSTMTGDKAMWALAGALYAMLALLIYAMWQIDWSVGYASVMVLCVYVGMAFGVFAGYVLAHVFRHGAM